MLICHPVGEEEQSDWPREPAISTSRPIEHEINICETPSHIPLDLVVDQWTSESESNSNPDFVF